MDQNLAVLPKKVWSILRLFYYMLRKGISKNKLWLDLNLMMKRAKLAGKTLQNLLFHHHHNWAAFAVNRPSPPPHLSFPNPSPPPGEYEFSCTTSPASKFSLFPFQKKHHSINNPTAELDVKAFNAAVLKAMEMIHSETASPVRPGFGRSPVVRQLRVTDSPFPVNSVEDDKDSGVDEAAEQFINRFYSDLRRQKQICGGEMVADHV